MANVDPVENIDTIIGELAETAVQKVEETSLGGPSEGEPEPPKKIWSEEHHFPIEFKLPSGQLVRGDFANKILNAIDHAKVGAYRAQLSGLVPYEALDPVTRAVTEQIAHLSISLIKKPDWAQNISQIKNLDLLSTIYQEVALHEASFRLQGTNFS